MPLTYDLLQEKLSVDDIILDGNTKDGWYNESIVKYFQNRGLRVVYAKPKFEAYGCDVVLRKFSKNQLITRFCH